MNKIITSFGYRAIMSASALALTMAATSGVAHAQLTSSAISGTVTDANGNAVSNANVTIVYGPTGSARTATTSGNGAFFASGLRVGGPYTITVSSPAGNLIEENVRLTPSSNNIRLSIAPVQDDDIVVAVGQQTSGQDIGDGVGTAFSGDDIIGNASTNRDLIGTLVRDPLSNSSGEGVLSVAGTNPRFTGLAIDGALQGDDFGLSSSTYPTARSPISLDAIESASVVAAEFDPAVSGFLGGLVNVVTKSGTNEIDGSLFYFGTGDEFFGDEAFNEDVDVEAFDENEYGFSLGGPIVKDKLFFFVNYDKFESGRGANFSDSDDRNGINPALFEGVRGIIQDTYGYDVGARPLTAALPVETERYLGKLDWEINADHRASFTYQRTEENGTSNVAAANFETAYYTTPQELNVYTGQLFSDWTDNFSTNFRVNYKENERDQLCNAGPGIGDIDIRLSEADLVGTDFEGFIDNGNGTVDTRDALFLTGGCDRFRQGNSFADERFQLFGQGTYLMGNHSISFGADYQNYSLDNLFAQRSIGEFRFNNLEDLANGDARVTTQLPDTGNRDDILASWGLDSLALFVGDSWQISPEFRLDAGLRYETIIQGDEPQERTFFEDQYGFSNQENLDGVDAIMPRLSFNWAPLQNTTISGGVGLFGGAGSPQVWVSNAFTPPVFFASTDVENADPTAGTPQDILDIITSNDANDPGPIDVISPTFDLPTDWKASLRIEQNFDAKIGGLDLGDDWQLSLQALYAATNQGFRWQNLSQLGQLDALPTGTAPDGRPIYADLDDLRLNNAIMLTNFDQGESLTLSASLAKSFDNGFDIFASYAYQDIETVTPGSSSRGVSNFRAIVDSDRNNPGSFTSPYELEHAFKVNVSFKDEIIKDLTTEFNLFGQITSGDPFSYTFDVDDNNALFGRSGDFEDPFDNDLLYVPTISGGAINDANVVVGSDFNEQAFVNFVNERGLDTGGIIDRNSDESPWNRRFDFRFAQEIPFFNDQAAKYVGDNSLKFVVDIFNVANLIDSDWGRQRGGPGFDTQNLVGADLVTAADVAENGVDGASALTGDDSRTSCQSAGDCVYRFNQFNTNRTETFNERDIASLYQIRVGLRYTF